MKEYKGYYVTNMGTLPMVVIRSKNAGVLPRSLTGLYTSFTDAFKAIDLHYFSLMKGNKRATTKDSNTD